MVVCVTGCHEYPYCDSLLFQCFLLLLLLLFFFFLHPIDVFSFKVSANGPMMTCAGLSILQALSYLRQIAILIPVKGYTSSLFRDDTWVQTIYLSNCFLAFSSFTPISIIWCWMELQRKHSKELKTRTSYLLTVCISC